MANIQAKPSVQLLELIEELKLPICPEDTLSHLEGLSEEEIETLLPSFEYVKAYHDGLSKEAKVSDLKAYQTADEAFQKELHELRKNYLKTEESLQEKYDDKADQVDMSAESQVSKLLEENKEDMQALEESLDLLNQKPTIAAPLV